MAQQVGRTSEAASAPRGVEVTPGGASGVTDAGWPAPPSETEGQAAQGLEPSGTALDPASTTDRKAGRSRGWLRRTAPAAVVTTTASPSVVAAGPDLDLASNDPLVGYLLSAASAVDITGLQLSR